MEMTTNIKEKTPLNEFNIALIQKNFLRKKKNNVDVGDKKKIRRPRATRNKTMQIVPDTALRSNPIKEEKR